MRLLDNSPRSGGRTIWIGLKLTTNGEDAVRYGIILGPPIPIPAALFAEVWGSTRTVDGMGWPGRISLGIFLPRPPPCQVTYACVGEGVLPRIRPLVAAGLLRTDSIATFSPCRLASGNSTRTWNR